MGDADVLLTYQVIARIVGSPALRGERITVRVQNGVVILLGGVRSAGARREATDRARTVSGVEDICDRLTGPADPDPFHDLVARWEPEPESAQVRRILPVAVALTLFTAVLLISIT